MSSVKFKIYPSQNTQQKKQQTVREKKMSSLQNIISPISIVPPSCFTHQLPIYFETKQRKGPITR